MEQTLQGNWGNHETFFELLWFQNKEKVFFAGKVCFSYLLSQEKDTMTWKWCLLKLQTAFLQIWMITQFSFQIQKACLLITQENDLGHGEVSWKSTKGGLRYGELYFIILVSRCLGNFIHKNLGFRQNSNLSFWLRENLNYLVQMKQEQLSSNQPGSSSKER